jgi:peptide deformylase
LPDVTANVRRATRVTVSGIGADGARASFSTEGFEARALLHEIDHLDGILILDRVASPSEIFRASAARSCVAG